MNRNELKNPIKRIAIKLGSAAVAQEKGGVDILKIAKIIGDIQQLKDSGIEVVLISSGAVATAKGHITFDGGTSSIERLQALSAIGQPLLMQSYSEELARYKKYCAQVLLTHEDFKNKNRYLNARNTLETLLKQNVLPILNENDSVAFDEITVGDNDQLAAMVAQMMACDLLLILSTPDGLYDKNMQNVPFVAHSEEVHKLVQKNKTAQGRGGMMSKLDAIRKVTPLGIPCIVSSFKFEHPILRAIHEKTGTFFEANPIKISDHKHAWLVATVKAHAYITIDDGAMAALAKGKSLLPVGLTKVQGTFKRGDCVSIKNARKVIGVGLIEYSSKELEKICRDKESIKNLLYSTEAIHRNNLVLRK